MQPKGDSAKEELHPPRDEVTTYTHSLSNMPPGGYARALCPSRPPLHGYVDRVKFLQRKTVNTTKMFSRAASCALSPHQGVK